MENIGTENSDNKEIECQNTVNNQTTKNESNKDQIVTKEKEEGEEEVHYVNIHEIHVIKTIEKKLGTNHFVLLNYELNPIEDSVCLLSDHNTLHVTFLNDIGSKEHLHFFIKYFPLQESPAKFAEGVGAFKKEMFIYKLFEEFLKLDINLISYIVPTCYLSVPSKYLILDDLCLEGYRNINKHNYLDYDSVLVVLQALAKLHATTFIFEHKMKTTLQHLYPEELEESFFNNKKNFANLEGVESCIKCILEEIQLFDFSRTLMSGKNFAEVAKTVCYKIYDMVKPSKRYKNVLTHGDIWATNILMKFDDKTQKPLCCKLVDFQCARYTPPAQDVVSFLYLTTSIDFRKKYMYEVVGMYYNYLDKNLRRSGLNVETVLPFDDFLESCEEQKLFAVVQAAFYFPLIFIKNEEIINYFTNEELNRKALFENRICLVLEHKDKDEFYLKRLIESIQDLKDICEVMSRKKS